MQAVPESRQQTFEEIYGPPENFLEIEVSRARVLDPFCPLINLLSINTRLVDCSLYPLLLSLSL